MTRCNAYCPKCGGRWLLRELPGNCPWCEIRKLKAQLAEPAEVRVPAMECSLRAVEADLDRTRAELSDALRLSPAEFQRLRKEKNAEIERLKAENELLADVKRLLEPQPVFRTILERVRDELADARKAALSLCTVLLYDDMTRDEIVKSALKKWPWLGPPEPPMAAHSSEAPQRTPDHNAS